MRAPSAPNETVGGAERPPQRLREAPRETRPTAAQTIIVSLFEFDEESKLLTMDFQPGFENYFIELGTPHPEYTLPPESGPTEDKLAEIAETSERYGMEITGPPPER